MRSDIAHGDGVYKSTDAGAHSTNSLGAKLFEPPRETSCGTDFARI
jgi:hypothetical protein